MGTKLLEEGHYSTDFTISIFTMRAMCSSKLSTICILTFVTLETMAMTIREEYQGGKNSDRKGSLNQAAQQQKWVRFVFFFTTVL